MFFFVFPSESFPANLAQFHAQNQHLSSTVTKKSFEHLLELYQLTMVVVASGGCPKLRLELSDFLFLLAGPAESIQLTKLLDAALSLFEVLRSSDR